jgi:hypothetical protein
MSKLLSPVNFLAGFYDSDRLCALFGDGARGISTVYRFPFPEGREPFAAACRRGGIRRQSWAGSISGKFSGEGKFKAGKDLCGNHSKRI